MINILPTLILSTFLSFIFFPQQFLHPQNYLAGPADPLQITYELNQIQQNILTGKPLYYATFFAPYQNTLTYNDPLLTSAIFTLPLKIFHLSPLFYSNFSFIFFGLIATSVTTYILIFHLTKNQPVSIFGSLLFTFSGFHLSHYGHLNVFNLWLLPLSLYFFHRLLEKNQAKFLILFLTTSSLQFLESFFSGYLIFFSCLFIFITHLSLHPSLAKWKTWVSLTLPSLAKGKVRVGYFPIILPFFIICLLLTFPYLNLHFTLPEATRSIRESAHFSLGPEEIITKYSSLTLLIIFFISIFIPPPTLKKSILPSPAKWKSRVPLMPPSPAKGRVRVGYLFILLFSLLMSLGPVLKFNHETVKIFGQAIPLPYTLFYYLFPGFTGFRTPSRWVLLFSLSATIIISQKLSLIFKNRQPSPSPINLKSIHKSPACNALHTRQHRQAKLFGLGNAGRLFINHISKNIKHLKAFTLRATGEKLIHKSYIINHKSNLTVFPLTLLFLLVIIEAQPPLYSIYVDQKIPTVYEQVKNLPDNSIILELPIRLSNSPDANIESLRSLYSLYHQKRRFNGLAGFAPQDWINLVNQINGQGLSPEIIDKLKQLGVTHIVENNSLRPLTPNL